MSAAARNPNTAVLRVTCPDQQQTELPPRRRSRPPHPLGVEAHTLLLDKLVKTALLHYSVQLFIERMRRRPRQLRVRDPKLFLPLLLLSSPHRPARILTHHPGGSKALFLQNPDLHTAARCEDHLQTA